MGPHHGEKLTLNSETNEGIDFAVIQIRGRPPSPAPPLQVEHNGIRSVHAFSLGAHTNRSFLRLISNAGLVNISFRTYCGEGLIYMTSIINGDSLGTAFTQRDLVTVVDG